MNNRINELAEQAWVYQMRVYEDNGVRTLGEREQIFSKEKFARLILNEVTNYLFDQSERMQEMASEEPSYVLADQHEACADACIDLIAGLEKHFGIK